MKKVMHVLLSMVFACLLIGLSEASDLRIDGSTTVLPIVQRAAEVFMKKYPDIKVFVSGAGSGVGIKGLIDGTVHIAMSSREAKDKEIALGKEKGVILVAHAIALDGVVPIVHPSMKIDNVTLEQLRRIYTGEIKSWKELGGPPRPIATVSRDTASGTYEIWNEKVLKGSKVRPDALLVASSGHMVRTVAENPYAIGYIGIGYIEKAIKPLKINGIAISPASVRDGTWPVARPLYLYTKGKPTGVVGKFIDFMLSAEGQRLVNEVKYVSIK